MMAATYLVGHALGEGTRGQEAAVVRDLELVPRVNAVPTRVSASAP